jgi:hypothetical protein
MTFGHGVGDLETWPARLEARLAEGGLSAQVFNAGLPDYGQAEEFVSLKEFLPVLTPDLVLLGFCVSNDVLNNLRCSEELPVRSEPNAFAQFIDHPLLTNPLARWSRAYRYGVWTYGRHWLRYELMHEPEALARTGRWLERLHAISRGADGRTIPMGLVLVPTVHQVSKTLSERIGRTVRVNDAVLSLCTELGLPALDPLAALRLETEPLYIPVDRHMNRAGNDALARAIVPFARELLELDATDQRR